MTSRFGRSFSPARLYASPASPLRSTNSIPAAWSETWSQSRTCIPSPYIGSGSPASALVTNSGMSFSGCWYGP